MLIKIRDRPCGIKSIKRIKAAPHDLRLTHTDAQGSCGVALE